MKERTKNFKDIDAGKEHAYSHPSATFIDENVLLLNSLYEEKREWVSLKLKKIPIKWFY